MLRGAIEDTRGLLENCFLEEQKAVLFIAFNLLIDWFLDFYVF